MKFGQDELLAPCSCYIRGDFESVPGPRGTQISTTCRQTHPAGVRAHHSSSFCSPSSSPPVTSHTVPVDPVPSTRSKQPSEKSSRAGTRTMGDRWLLL
ncbi:MAG: hypothetical protein SGPRY_014803, partial [Prymnesium sp.]